MTFDTHRSMTTHKIEEYWFLEEVKFQCLHNTSNVAVKLSEWTHDVGVVTRNVVFVGKLWRTSYTKKKHTSPVHRLTMPTLLLDVLWPTTAGDLVNHSLCFIAGSLSLILLLLSHSFALLRGGGTCVAA